jgi:hypothetical protein
MEDSISREARGGSPLASCCPHATVFNSIQQPIRVRSLFTNPIEKKKISSSETDTTAPRGVRRDQHTTTAVACGRMFGWP